MKKLLLIISISIISLAITNKVNTPIEKISSITHSSYFNILIERLDFGYVINQQSYSFNIDQDKLFVSQLNTSSSIQKLTLKNTELNLKTINLLTEYCADIKSFELDKIDEHKKLFNTLDAHDFIYLSTPKDTVLLSDVHSKAINDIRNIIENNRQLP